MKAKGDEEPEVKPETSTDDEDVIETAPGSEEDVIAIVDEADPADAIGEADMDSPVQPAVQEVKDQGQGDFKAGFSGNIKRILDIQLPVTVSFGSTSRPLAEVLKMSPGSLIELETTAEEPVVLKVNDKPFAWGRVVDVDGYYGVEITEIVGQADRIATLGGN
ncbi:MAG: FliM/FliN family flagellar motor switch protein [Acidobacteriota bacterium]|jgi:flagellar motor switch protein FliN